MIPIFYHKTIDKTLYFDILSVVFPIKRKIMNKDCQNQNNLPRIRRNIKKFLANNLFSVIAIPFLVGLSLYTYNGDYEAKKPIVGLLGYQLGSNISDAKNIHGKDYHHENYNMIMKASLNFDETKPNQSGYLKYSKYTNEIYEISYTLDFDNIESCRSVLSSLEKELRDYYITDDRNLSDKYSLDSRTIKASSYCNSDSELSVIAIDRKIEDSIAKTIEKNNAIDSQNEIKKGNELISNTVFKEKS